MDHSRLKLKIALSLIILTFMSGVIAAEPLAPVVLLLPILWFLVRRSGEPRAQAAETVVPGYTLLHELGRGGTAVVYNARHDATGQTYALKLLKTEPGMDQDASSRMRREIKLMRDLQHPGIVPLCDFGEYNGQVYLVLEKIDGVTLREHLERGRLSFSQAMRNCEALLDALSYAHSRNVIHRDLKPENLMVRSDGQLRLLDFGFSRNTHRNTFETLDNSVVGTPAYISPERLMCVTLPASDQYSIGLIAYEMLTGQPAIPRGLDIARVITKQLHELPPSLCSLDHSIPPEVDRFVMKLIAKRPEDRFESMQAALENFRSLATSPTLVTTGRR